MVLRSYMLQLHVFHFWKGIHGEKDAISGTDAPVSLVIMTDALPL